MQGMHTKPKEVLYGQVVGGPPGSGKTTYCNGMQQYLRLLGRNAVVINLDPANEVYTSRSSVPNKGTNSNSSTQNQILPYDTIFDVCHDVVNLSSVMKKLGLGPNGGLVYCMEYLETHVDEIVTMMSQRIADKEYMHQKKNENNKNKDNHDSSLYADKPYYLIIDLPGQVELYTHTMCVPNLLHYLMKALNIRLTGIQLIDAHYCTDANKFLSAALLGTTTMLRLELPMVNVLSKVDLLLGNDDGEPSAELAFPLEFYTDCFDLQRLIPFLDDNTIESMSNQRNNIPRDHNNQIQYDKFDDYDAIHDDPHYQLARRRRENSKFHKKRSKLFASFAEVIEDFGMLSFTPLNISDAENVGRVLAQIDKCNGYIYAASAEQQQNMYKSNNETSGAANDLFKYATESDGPLYFSPSKTTIDDIQERAAFLQQQTKEQQEQVPLK